MYRHLKTIIPLSILIVLLVTAVFGFSYFERIDLFEALWMTVTTVLTVGYGDISPQTDSGRVLAIILVPVCIILFTYFMGMIISRLVEFKISVQKRSRQMEKKIKRLSRHIILCGLSPMTETIIKMISQDKRDFVLIEPDEDKAEPYIESYNIILGDPCEDDMLLRAGIEKAGGLITTRGDAENLLIVLTSRGLNPDIRITSSAERIESEPKLIKAGADRVINAERIGGTRMALSVLKPAAVDYLDRIFTSDTESFRIEELLVTAATGVAGKTIKDASIRSKYGLSIMAVKRGGKILTTGIADLELTVNDVMIVFGEEEKLDTFRSQVKAERI